MRVGTIERSVSSAAWLGPLCKTAPYRPKSDRTISDFRRDWRKCGEDSIGARWLSARLFGEKEAHAPSSVRGHGYGTWLRHASEQLQRVDSSNDILPSDIDAAPIIPSINLLYGDNASPDVVELSSSPNHASKGHRSTKVALNNGLG